MSQKQIRNFVIISHIDHGKSTLADRFLELTKTISPKEMRPQFLDMMELERERGITIKLQPVRLEFQFSISDIQFPKSRYILNLVDTPGHVDFSYEVSRSLAAVEGAVLLVDATKGIQAQTLANLELAQRQNIIVIPVVNKIDLAQARTEETVEELAGLLKLDKKDIIKISAKLGTNVDKLLEALVKKIPPPKENEGKPFRALIFDSFYDSYKGVVAYIRVVDGQVKSGEKIKLLAVKASAEAKELGYFSPDFSPQDKLSAGEIGYIATGIKEPGRVRVGDTIIKIPDVEPLPGYQEPKPMVFASLYPEEGENFDLLKEGLSRLKLNDPSLVYEPETKEALGRGFRCGFLGTLHAEIASERLWREFGLNLIISSPSVVYKADGKPISSVSDWPERPGKTEEPWAYLEIITPTKYLGKILKNIKGNYIETRHLSAEKVVLVYEIPLREVIANLYDKIKGLTQGYASMNYRFLGYREADLVKMDILIAGERESAFSRIVPKKKAEQEGRALVKKLKETLPSQQFSVALQAAVEGKVIARETIRARGKDVIAPLYGGDYTRKRKLLDKQKKGKRRLREKGRVRIPARTFLEIFRRG